MVGEGGEVEEEEGSQGLEKGRRGWGLTGRGNEGEKEKSNLIFSVSFGALDLSRTAQIFRKTDLQQKRSVFRGPRRRRRQSTGSAHELSKSAEEKSAAATAVRGGRSEKVWWPAWGEQSTKRRWGEGHFFADGTLVGPKEEEKAREKREEGRKEK